MEKMGASFGAGAASKRKTVSDPRIRMVEHIVAHYDRSNTTDVRSILNETKVGAWKQPTLLTMIKNIMAES